MVLATGREASAEDLNARVHAALMVGHDVDLDWHPRLTVGFASGPADSDVSMKPPSGAGRAARWLARGVR